MLLMYDLYMLLLLTLSYHLYTDTILDEIAAQLVAVINELYNEDGTKTLPYCPAEAEYPSIGVEENALLPKTVTSDTLFKYNEIRLQHLLNVKLEMLVHIGKLTVVNEQQKANAAVLTLVQIGKFAAGNNEQFENAQLPITEHFGKLAIVS